MNVRALILAVLAFPLQAAVAPAATLRVGQGERYPTVSAALAAAVPGDTLDILPGSYRENLVIDRRVTIRGAGEVELVGLGEGSVVRVVADGVEISGLTIRGSGDRMMTGDAGVRISGDRAHLADNRVVDNLFGVYLDGCAEALVEGNTITGRREMDIGRRGAGVHFYDASHNIVRDNRVSFVRDGVYFDHADFNTVEGNHFSDLRYGVHYMYCSDNSFVGNVFRDSVAGVAIMYSQRVVFRDNQIFDNRAGYHAFGLLLKECEDSVAEGNAIVNNVSGIFLDGSHRNVFRHNLVAYNDVGVVLYASSLENRFEENDFIGNLATLHTVGRAEADWTPDGRGNHFSGYPGYDLDGDGRGEVPHHLQDAFEYLEGNHPLLHLYLSSAAADALAAAERSFPVIPSSDQRDFAPSLRPVSGTRITAVGRHGAGDGSAAAAGAFGLVLGVTLFAGWRLRR